ncbi:MAG: succinylglutamate desuccinylase/aspartoacylase family protein [Geminicoccaceae bacterium]|nr:succinylglutamate desuccinylase/aspartoacylase family protein [Geminicoccaceae bacterium]
MTTPVEFDKPDISSLRRSHDGIDWITVIDSGKAGPHLVINALIHGNEISGPWSILRLIDSGLRPRIGKLSLSLANVAAFEAFDAGDPTATRFLDEDMNRLWMAEKLEGDGDSVELRRARELLPFYRTADFLLDLHSMQTPSPALTLSTMRRKGRQFATRMGCPKWIVADKGHANGTRLIDFDRFGDPHDSSVAVLVEAGQHWARSTLDESFACCLDAMRVAGLASEDDVAPLRPSIDRSGQKLVEVTHAVTIKTDRFAFHREFTGLEVVETAGTPIASDGDEPVLTPYDNCVLVMPSKRLQPGLTAVRLGRLQNRQTFETVD